MQVAVHYLFQSLRALPPAQVYRSLILGFMMADADPRFVGVNIVMPEDAYLARRDYTLPYGDESAFLRANIPR